MQQTAHAHQCHRSPQGEYQRHQPELSTLYQTVSAYWTQFLERAQEQGGLPDFVKREVEAYLDCGILEKGHVIARCRSCGFERTVPFSCKKRGFCPSCMGRRMNDTAAHLVDRVLPLDTPIRQWVCSMPFSLRYLMGYDKKLCADMLSMFASELMHSYKMRAKHLLGLRSVNDAHTGAVTLVQRFDSALRLNVHPHTLAIDGVYVQDDDDRLIFHPLPEPTHAEVATLAGRIAERAEAIMRKHGRWVDTDSDCSEPDQLSLQQPVLSACYQASAQGVDILSQRAGRPTLRLMTTPPALSTSTEPGPVAVVRGFNLHAATFVDGIDRERLERLCQYIGRPPIAQDRLHILDDGRVRYDMKRVWADGTRAIVLDPMDFIARLCALVPPPYFHMVRFHALLAPNSSLRPQVVPLCTACSQTNQPQQLQLWDTNADGNQPPKTSSGGRHPWAWLLKRVFKLDVTVCPKCQGNMRVVEVVSESQASQRAQQRLAPMPPP